MGQERKDRKVWYRYGRRKNEREREDGRRENGGWAR